jgi:formylglycine-generating enzyme required for sulfatase activity
MGGNVWQWCEDEYRASMNNPDVLIANPTLKEEKSQSGMPYRVLRGGCWVSLSEMTMRSSYRSGDFPSLRDGTFGFRCVLVISDD